MTRTRSAELVLDENAHLAESPVWDPRSGHLLWVDIDSRIIFSSDIDRGVSQRRTFDHPVGCIAPAGRTGYVLAGGAEFILLDSFNAVPTRVPAFDDPQAKLNDGALDADGCFWAGSACLDGVAAHGGLYRLNHELRAQRVLAGVTTSNGFDWSPDNRHFYYVDTAAACIDRFDVEADSGELRNRHRLVDIPATMGLADGLTVDVDGCIWLAIWFLGAVHRYSPRGELMERVEVPTCLTTSCAFGGSDMSTLFITTAKGTPRAERPLGAHAGAIFAVSTSTHGQIRPEYRGIS